MLCIMKVSSKALYSCPWATTQCPQSSTMHFPHDIPLYFNIGHIATYTWWSHSHGHNPPLLNAPQEKNTFNQLGPSMVIAPVLTTTRFKSDGRLRWSYAINHVDIMITSHKITATVHVPIPDEVPINNL